MPDDGASPAFECAAASYDGELAANPAMRYMRAVSLGVLADVFLPGQRLLEIGCGTGEEALALVQRGCTVLATDVSPAMIAVAQARAEGAGLCASLQLRVLDAAALGQLGGETFDGAYSSFGPLNGLDELRPVLAALSALVRPGGVVVLSVMNRWYPLEIAWFLLRGRPRQALRRWWNSGAPVSTLAAGRMATHYHSLRALRRAMKPWFRLRCCRALPVLLPPPYMASLWERCPRLIAALRGWEERLAWRWPWCGLGDHWLAVLERRLAENVCGEAAA